MFNYRCVSGGRWLEDIDNIQCFFSSFLASELYLRDSEPGCVREGWVQRQEVLSEGTKQDKHSLDKYLLGTHIGHTGI